MSNNLLSITGIVVLLGILIGCENSDSDNNEEFNYQSQLRKFDGCGDLKTYLIETAEKRRQLIGYYVDVPEFSPVQLDTTLELDASLSSVADASSNPVDHFTGTNNQVSGVDEADFVKTDGDFTYVLSGNHFLIFDTWPAVDSSELSRVEMKGRPSHLFVEGEIAWVVSTLYQPDIQAQSLSFAPRIQVLTQVSLFDISDRELPELIRTSTFEASFVNARKIDGQVHMVLNAYLKLWPLLDDKDALELDDLLPRLSDHLIATNAHSDQLISDCSSIFRPGTPNGTGTISLVSFDLNNPLSDLKRQSILSNSGLVYANESSLYLASVEDNYWIWWPVMDDQIAHPKPGTTLHKFDLQGEPQYVASGRVDGYLINQFAMDEYEGLLRTVTTIPGWWTNQPPTNTLSILQQDKELLTERSQLTDLGKPGETLFAARFLDDKAFLVTFEQIDPLYTLDLSDADNPRVVGELEVPGFSTYLHPIADDLLLAIGRGENNSEAVISLFDVSDFANPSLLDKTTLGKGSSTAAAYDHKAFTWYQQQNLLAIPRTTWAGNLITDSFSSIQLFNGLTIFKVDRESGFTSKGLIDHSNFYRDDQHQRWYYPDAIRRSFFVADAEQNSYLYSLSTRGLKVHASDDFETELAALSLPTGDWSNWIWY